MLIEMTIMNYALEFVECNSICSLKSSPIQFQRWPELRTINALRFHSPWKHRTFCIHKTNEHLTSNTKRWQIYEWHTLSVQSSCAIIRANAPGTQHSPFLILLNGNKHMDLGISFFTFAMSQSCSIGNLCNFTLGRSEKCRCICRSMALKCQVVLLVAFVNSGGQKAEVASKNAGIGSQKCKMWWMNI